MGVCVCVCVYFGVITKRNGTDVRQKLRSLERDMRQSAQGLVFGTHCSICW